MQAVLWAHKFRAGGIRRWLQHRRRIPSAASASSTSKLIAQNRLASLMYPGEQSLQKFGWSDRVKEYLAEIKLSREDFPAPAAELCSWPPEPRDADAQTVFGPPRIRT